MRQYLIVFSVIAILGGCSSLAGTKIAGGNCGFVGNGEAREYTCVVQTDKVQPVVYKHVNQ